MQIFITIALIIIGVLLFEFIIFAHEFGHFITAKKSGVQVNEFALGMGPKLFSFKKGETRYSLRLFPIGGFCAMEGEDEASDNPRAFTNAKVWKRMIIIVAGAFMNFVVGFLLMFIVVVQQPCYESTVVDGFSPVAFSANCGLQEGDEITSVNGYSIWNAKDLQFAIQTLQCVNVDPASVEVYKEDCAVEARNAAQDIVDGWKDAFGEEISDDHLAQLNDALTEGRRQINKAETKEEANAAMRAAIDSLYAVNHYSEKKAAVYPEIKERDERVRYTGDLTVKRDGETVELEGVQFYSYYNSQEDADAGKVSVAIDFYVKPIEKTFGTVLQQTVSQTATMAKTVWQSLVMLVQGRFTFNDLSGPVGITRAVSMVASEGLKVNFLSAVNNIIYIMALITVNLGVVNLLPFPALDGGRFVFLLIEAVIRRPLPRKFEYVVNAAGLIILIGFIIVISAKDVWQLITGTFPSL
ncbi:MAG: RIP metalloprotease RseP [Ruminococcus sp.]